MLSKKDENLLLAVFNVIGGPVFIILGLAFKSSDGFKAHSIVFISLGCLLLISQIISSLLRKLL